MKRQHYFAAIAFGLALAASACRAQPAAPRIGFIYPAGGQQGAQVTVSVGGHNLTGASAVLISGAGIEASVVGHERPLSQRDINDLREEAARLQEKRVAHRADSSKPAITATDEKRATEIRHLLGTRGNRQATPAIAETVTLELRIAPNASPGDRELRVMTAGGLSNPLALTIGRLPEVTPPVVTATSARSARGAYNNPTATRREPALAISLPALVNGQILPGEVDRFRFSAKRGQRLTFVVSARALIPYLADAVPGWFQATLAIRDTQGRELAYADDYRFAPDPVISCEIPTDGEYVVEIKDALFRGREDFVYRIAAGELPFVTSIFPLGGPVGARTKVELTGWHLARTEIEFDAANLRPETLPLSVLQGSQFSNSVKFAVSSASECRAAESDDSTAQALTLPMLVNGRIDRPGDEDTFRFVGRAGETIVAEVSARRLGSPVDSVLTLCDETGRVLATNDDGEDKREGLLTHHADSRLTATLPTEGRYILRIADAQRQGGRDYGYRLRVGPPQPDFALRVVPSTINLRAGGTVPITVYALRRDGFAGEIRIGSQQAANGLVLSGGRIPPGEEKVRMTLTATPSLRENSFALRLLGTAKVEETEYVRAVVPADDMMQAFAYYHLVPAQELRVQVSGKGSTLRPETSAVVALRTNAETKIRIRTALKSVRNPTFELHEAPPGVTVAGVRNFGNVAEIRISCDPEKLKAGSRGNLILQAFGERVSSTEANTTRRGTRTSLGFVPAIPFEVHDTFAHRF